MKRFFRKLRRAWIWATDREVLKMINDGADYERICNLVSIKARGNTVKVYLYIIATDYGYVYVSPKVIKFLRWVRKHADMDTEDFCWLSDRLCEDCGEHLEY